MADLEPTPTATIQYAAISGVADLEPTPTATLTIQYAAISEVRLATAEDVVMVGMLGSGGSNSTVVASNVALESHDQSRPKYAEDATKLDVIASPDYSREQVSELCKICKEGKTGDEDPLICLGCSCPSDVRPAHRSCIKAYFGRGVKGGESFCRLCRDVLSHHVSKVAVGISSGDDDKRGSMTTLDKQLGFMRLGYPTPPPVSNSDHQVEMPRTLDVSNAHKAEEEEAFYKFELIERIELCVWILFAPFVVATIVFAIVFIVSNN